MKRKDVILGLAALPVAGYAFATGQTSTTVATARASVAPEGTTAVVKAAKAFLATLTASQRKTVQFSFSNTAQKQRWSNFPEGIFQRAGLMWGTMTAAQQKAWLAVMAATLSTEGYRRVLQEWHADQALAATDTGGGNGPGGGTHFGMAYYYIAILGTPSATSPWMWQFGGHHVTVNATIVGQNIALTPSFIGVQPATYKDAQGKTIRPLGDIEDAAFALINALTAAQRSKAVLGTTPIDLVLGPGQDNKTLQPEGLAASAMTAAQKAQFLTLIGHYTNLVNSEDAAIRMATITSHLAQTYLAWYGPITRGSAAYFRVTGPAIVIEYAPQGGGGPQGGNGGGASTQHIHGIYRDPTNDYGAALVKAVS